MLAHMCLFRWQAINWCHLTFYTFEISRTAIGGLGKKFCFVFSVNVFLLSSFFTIGANGSCVVLHQLLSFRNSLAAVTHKDSAFHSQFRFYRRNLFWFACNCDDVVNNCCHYKEFNACSDELQLAITYLIERRFWLWAVGHDNDGSFECTNPKINTKEMCMWLVLCGIWGNCMRSSVWTRSHVAP